MLIGELMFNGETVNTPGVARGGSKGVFSVNTLSRSHTSASLIALVTHKNFADTAYSTIAGAAITLTVIGIATTSATSLKEQVRLEITIGGTTGDWARAFVFEPTWED